MRGAPAARVDQRQEPCAVAARLAAEHAVAGAAPRACRGLAGLHQRGRRLPHVGGDVILPVRLVQTGHELCGLVEERYQQFGPENTVTAYTAAFILALIAVLALVVVTSLRPKEDSR